MTRRILHATVVENEEKLGTTWDIRDQANRAPKINIGFAGPKLLIHQENPKSNDVIEVTVGQAYDLLTVISRALGLPVKGFE